MFHQIRRLTVKIDPIAPMARWYLKYREGSPLQVDDWEEFRENSQLIYRSYIKQQNQSQTFIDRLIDKLERQYSHADRSAGWIEILERLYIPSQYSTQGLQMMALYVGQMAPFARISSIAHFQASDEVRRLQRSAYRARMLSRVHSPDVASRKKIRQIWENDRAWQPMRELIEKLSVAYDWGEAFVGLNLVVKPLYDGLMLGQLSQLAQLNGDRLLAYTNSNFALDSQRSRDWTQALVEHAIERRSENRQAIEEWVKKWQPLGFSAVASLAEIFATAPTPVEPAFVSKSVLVSYQKFLDRCNLGSVLSQV
ncbi:MAG: hypothetical protein KME17_31740 [Cyanosarcina radialis HA8281-LM2]|jgi:toluene monooxygenase system protein E|nr:hypothetical protein [Cyanosarcina radialis HA8281-LM2]